jgi:TonB family protein
MEKVILECVVRSLLIAVCTAAALFVLRVKAARVRHAIWAGVVVLMLILPVETAWGPKAVLRVLKPEPAIVYAQPIALQQPLSDPEGAALPQRSELWTLQNALLAAYVLGFAALMARLITGTMRVRKLTSERCVAPITVGWLRPTVILPPDSKQWSPEQLNAVLIHEDEHARHRDPMVQWVALLNRAIFWFHPLAWWLERRLSALAEEACDDAVLTQGHDPVQYSEYLLALARTVQEAGGMAMARTFLPQRIRRIATGSPQQPISRSRRISLAVICLAVSAIFTIGAVGRTPAFAADAHVGPAPAAPEPIPAAPAPVLPAEARPVPKPRSAPIQTSQSLSGVVADPSDGVVARAPVTLTDTATGLASLTTTDNTGSYQFQNITPGTYSLTVKTPGFKAETWTNIHVALGEAHNAGRMRLQAGAIYQSVTVTGSNAAPQITIPPAAPEPFITTLNAVKKVARMQPQPPARPGDPIRVGGNIQASKIISQTKPVYPQDAFQQNSGGTVKIEAVVTKEGALSGVNVINSPDPRLTQAALDAVKQWRYEPTLLNGEPIEVLTTIDVIYQPGN